MTRAVRLAALAAILLGLACAGAASAQTTVDLTGDWKDAQGQHATISQDGKQLEIRFTFDFFHSQTSNKDDWVFKGTADAQGFDILHVKDLGNAVPGIPACVENAPEKYPLHLIGKIGENGDTIHATLAGEYITYDKKSCAITKEEPRTLAFDLTRDCKIDEKIAGWKLEAACPDDVLDGVKEVKATSPSGWEVRLPTGLIGYALPVRDRSHLFSPVVLPDLNVTAGGLTLAAYENTLTSDGVTVGTAGIALPKYGVDAVAYDLHIGSGFKVSAGSLELALFHSTFEANDITFTPDDGLNAKTVIVGLPAILGGGSLEGTDFGIDANGIPHGTFSGAQFQIGDIQVKFSQAKLTETGFEIGHAELTLPPYLGGTTLAADGFAYNATTGAISLQHASGGLDFSLAGGKVAVTAKIDLALKANNGYRITGSGSVIVPGSPNPFFQAKAKVDIESVDCDPAPGPCRNAAYLHEASISIKVGRPVPLGQTGLGIAGLQGSVGSTQDHPYLDAAGDVHGVTYQFGLGADLASTVDNGFSLTSTISGDLSTNGNFGLSVNGTTMGFLTLHGGICVRFVATADPVCNKHMPADKLAKIVGTGVYIEGGAEAGVSYTGYLGTVNATLRAQAFGRFVTAGGESYIDATVGGSLTAAAHSWLLPDVEGGGSVQAELGAFTTPQGGETLGIKGSLDAILHTHSIIFGDSDEELHRAIFIDQDGTYTEENVNAYQLGRRISSVSSADAVPGTHQFPFAVVDGQKQTTLTVAWPGGAAPQLTLTSPSGVSVVVSSQSGTPSMTITPAAGHQLSRDQLGRFAYLVRLGMANAIEVYLPSPEAGNWSAQLTNFALTKAYRFDVHGNLPLPVLRITTPGAATTTATPKNPVAHIAGTLSGSASGQTLSVFAATSPCTGGRTPAVPGTLVAPRVHVRSGRWSTGWSTGAVPSGKYTVYAILDNGKGPQVIGCATGTIVVAQPKAPQAPHSLHATLAGNRLTVRWTAPAAAGTIRGYRVRWRATGPPAGPWAVLDVGNVTHATISVNRGARYEIGVSAYDVDGHTGAAATTHVGKAPRAPTKPKPKPKPKPASHPKKKTAAPVIQQSRALAAADAKTRQVPVPIFDVTTSTPQIAANDEAAITGVDPSTGTPAETVQNGAEVPYPGGAAATLEYGRLSPKTGYTSVSKANRKIACGADPFKDGSKPGPPDGTFNKKKKTRTGGTRTSCDEYPFASSVQGGNGAIVRGVKLAENLSQGGQLSAFLQKYANDLKLLGGKFQVCVDYNGTKAGDCTQNYVTVTK
jgi:Deoxyribonuclease NucA/NucB